MIPFIPQAPQPQDPQPQDPELQKLIDAAVLQTIAANKEQQSAQTDYQSALSAPMARVDPTAAALSMGLSRLGTVLAGPHGPNYSAQNAAMIESRNKNMEADRQANITRLRATYEAAAQRAAQAGNHEAEIKARAAIHKIDAQADKDKAAAEEKYRNAQNARQTASDAETARHNKAMEDIGRANVEAKDKSSIQDINDVVDNNTRTVTFNDGTSKDYIDATNLKGKDLTAAQQVAAKTGKPLLSGKQIDGIHEVENAVSTVQAYIGAIEPLVARSALSPKRLTAPLKSWLGIGEESAIQSYNEAMIQIIPALISRGIRITQGEIKQLQANTPNLSLPLNVNQKRAKVYEEVLDKINRRQLAIGKGRASVAPTTTVTLTKDGVSKTLSREEFDKRGGEAAARQHGYTVQ